MTEAERHHLLLCAGLQGSGSTLISWCFLQRADTNGVLDANGDMVPDMPGSVRTPYAWYKTTISAFRLTELEACAQDDGWTVRPLLVVRDVRVVWSSLARKQYGVNGTTAEDPPLRARLRRFHADWKQFREQGRPMIGYEAFVREPEVTLRAACTAFGMEWDDAMLTWPKPPEAMADVRHGNHSFLGSRAGGLRETLKPDLVDRIATPIPSEDLAWLETEFAEFNEACGYAAHRDVASSTETRAQPTFEVTRRFKWRLHQKPVRMLLHRLGWRS